MAEIVILSVEFRISYEYGSQYFKTIGNTYEIPDNASIQFVFSERRDDVAQKLTVIHSNFVEPTYDRKEKTDFSKLKLSDYTGNFYSQELDVTYLLFLEDGKLKMKVANYQAQKLTPHDIDTFTTEGGLARFNKSNGVIKGFELDAGRVTKLKFEKK